jgi:hypothetical protein
MLSYSFEQITTPYLWIEFLAGWSQVLTNLFWSSLAIIFKLHDMTKVCKIFYDQR